MASVQKETQGGLLTDITVYLLIKTPVSVLTNFNLPDQMNFFLPPSFKLMSVQPCSMTSSLPSSKGKTLYTMCSRDSTVGHVEAIHFSKASRHCQLSTLFRGLLRARLTFASLHLLWTLFGDRIWCEMVCPELRRGFAIGGAVEGFNMRLHYRVQGGRALKHDDGWMEVSLGICNETKIVRDAARREYDKG